MPAPAVRSNAVTAKAPTRGSIAQWFKQMTIVRLVHEIVTSSLSDDILGLAAEFAYNAIFAIPAFLIFLVALAAVANQVTGIPVADDLRHLVNEGAPEGTRVLLDRLVRDAIEINARAASLGAVISIILALWSGSSVIKTLIKAFNRAYGVEETRPFLHQRLTSIVLTVFSAVLIITSFVLFVFGAWIGVWIADAFRLGVDFTAIWNLLRMPLAIIMTAFLMVVIYLVGPNVKGSFLWVALGSAVATALWVAAVLGFRYYLVVVNPGGPFGVAGSVLVLLFFLYITGLIFMFGGEINGVLHRHRHSRPAVAYPVPKSHPRRKLSALAGSPGGFATRRERRKPAGWPRPGRTSTPASHERLPTLAARSDLPTAEAFAPDGRRAVAEREERTGHGFDKVG